MLKHIRHLRYIFRHKYYVGLECFKVGLYWRGITHGWKANKHHWQYWTILNDSGSVVALDMPMKYRKEMLADWRGTSRTLNRGVDNTKEWYLNNMRDKALHPTTRAWVEWELQLDWRDRNVSR